MATGGLSDIETGTDETFDFLCSVCIGKKKKVEGEKFCADCNDYYCSTCVKSHNEFPALRTHKILDKTQFKPGSSIRFPAVPTERCTLHGHKPVDMYCRQHDKVGCSTCMVVQHSDCRQKFYVPDYVKNSTTASLSDSITVQLESIYNDLVELYGTLTENKEKLSSSKEKSLKQIQKFRIKINQRLDEMEKNTIQEFEARFQAQTDKINAILKEVEASQTNVKYAQESLKSAAGNMSQQFVSNKISNDVASQVREKINTSKTQISSTEMSFLASQKLKSLMYEINTLGNIVEEDQVQSQSQSPASFLQTSTQTSQKPREVHSNSALLQIEGCKQYTVKVKSDKKTCDILSACTLHDGSIILADRNNCNLKRLDSFYFSVTGYCSVPDRPWQVCAITNPNVAVSCSSSSLIQIVSCGLTFQKTRQISTGFECYGLAFADKKIFVSDQLTSVYVYSLSGERLQQFSNAKSGQQMFSAVVSLSVSTDNTKIYVVDSVKGLTILDRNGQIVGKFKGSILKGAYGVCLYDNDNVLVCDKANRNVLQFSADAKLIGEVLNTDGACQAVCFNCNSKKSQLIVVYDRKNEMEVYNVKGC